LERRLTFPALLAPDRARLVLTLLGSLRPFDDEFTSSLLLRSGYFCIAGSTSATATICPIVISVVLVSNSCLPSSWCHRAGLVLPRRRGRGNRLPRWYLRSFHRPQRRHLHESLRRRVSTALLLFCLPRAHSSAFSLVLSVSLAQQLGLPLPRARETARLVRLAPARR
jgi:hypothetical protein